MTIEELAELIRKERRWEGEIGEHHATFVVPTAPDRSHHVRLTEFRHENFAYVRFVSVIGPAESIGAVRATSALSLNGHLAMGAVAVIHDEFVLTETQLLGRIDPAVAILTISYLAHQADRYEQVMFGEDVE